MVKKTSFQLDSSEVLCNCSNTLKTGFKLDLKKIKSLNISVVEPI